MKSGKSSLTISAKRLELGLRLSDWAGVTMELWDPFFGAMKSTQLLLTQLPMPWEADVDLRSNTWETLLGLG